MDDEKTELTPDQIEAAAKQAKKAMKSAAKAEKKRLKEEQALNLAKQLKRDELGREFGLSSLIYQQHEAEWEQAMVNIKQENLRQEVECLWTDVRSIVDRKANLIERLTVNREDAREQIRKSSTVHLQFLDHAKKMFQSFARSLKDMYEIELECELSEFRSHYLWKKQITTRRKHFFESLMLGSNAVFDDGLETAKFQFDRERSDFIDNDIERRETMRDSIQLSMQRMFGQMKKTAEEIHRTSMAPDRLKVYARLVERQQDDAECFAKMARKSLRSSERIAELTEQRNHLEMSTMKSLSEMKKEKEYFMDCYAVLRDVYDSDMKLDQQRMRYLMDKTYTTICFLKDLEKRGGLILGVSAVIRKFQSEKEKVVPWGDNYPDMAGSNKAMGASEQMEPMWLQISAVNAQNLALEEEKRSLETENQQLRDSIRRYCSQEKYERCIRTLNISNKPTVVIPAQEAAHMAQLNRHSTEK